MRNIKGNANLEWEKTWTEGGKTARRTRRLLEVPSKANLTY